MRMRLTSAGPHRDDLCVMANGIDIRKYGSQGQQRTAALSLKLSEIYIVKRKIKDTPVLLLDDVLSELDSSITLFLFAIFFLISLYDKIDEKSLSDFRFDLYNLHFYFDICCLNAL